MAFDMIEAMTLIAREKNIEFDAVLETLKGSLLAAAKKKYEFTDNISFKFDRKNNELLMMITKKVVKEVEDKEVEISLAEAQEIDPEAEIGDEIAASAGAACHAGEVNLSAVLEAMQVPVEWAMGTLRFSVGRSTSPEEIDRAVQVVTEAVRALQTGDKGHSIYVDPVARKSKGQRRVEP